MGVERLDVLPFAPTVMGLTVDHFDTLAGPETMIGRKVKHPESCPMCPGRECQALVLGFCNVRAPEYVPDELAANYVLPAPVGRA